MKKSIYAFLITFLTGLSLSGYGQQLKKSIPAVKYGNNPKARKYLATRGIKLYYEIYGQGL